MTSYNPASDGYVEMSSRVVRPAAERKPISFSDRDDDRDIADCIVVNQLLCFITNNIDIISLPTDTIVQLCENVYDNAEVELSKSFLFASCAKGDRHFTRKGPI